MAHRHLPHPVWAHTLIYYLPKKLVSLLAISLTGLVKVKCQTQNQLPPRWWLRLKHAGALLYKLLTIVVKPRRMHEGYNSWLMCVCVCVCVCVSVCLSITTLAAVYLVYMSKVRQHTVFCRPLKICIAWTSLKTFHSGDMVSFACHNDWRLSKKHTTDSWHNYKWHSIWTARLS